MPACGAAGGFAVGPRTSTHESHRACPCCLPLMPNWPSLGASSTKPTAPRRGQRAWRLALPSIAAATFRTPVLMAALKVWETAPRGTLETVAAVTAAEATGVAAAEVVAADRSAVKSTKGLHPPPSATSLCAATAGFAAPATSRTACAAKPRVKATPAASACAPHRLPWRQRAARARKR